MIGAAIPLALVLLAVLYRLGRLKELHHGWYGVALLCLPWWPAWVVGAVLYADDFYQHAVEARALSRGEAVPADFTPIHKLGSVIVQAWRDWRAA